eukprot:EG_transcript_11560
MEAEWERMNPVRFTALIAVSGLIEDLLFHPLRVLKTVEQVDTTISRRAGLLDHQLRLARVILQRNGWQGFFRGFWFSNLSSMPCYLVNMLAYHKFKHELTADHLPSAVRCVAPFTAGVLAQLVVLPIGVPVDVVVQRMQLPQFRSTRSLALAQQIFAAEGLRGMYKGFAVTAGQSTLSSAIFWCSYEHTKAYTSRLTGASPTGATRRQELVTVVSGVVAGSLSSLTTLPIDVVKTRMQCEATRGRGATPAALTHYHTFRDSCRHLYATEGCRGFLRGLAPRLVSRGPLTAVSCLLYEQVLAASMRP